MSPPIDWEREPDSFYNRGSAGPPAGIAWHPESERLVGNLSPVCRPLGFPLGFREKRLIASGA
jgi:hypothetical protein